MRRKFFLLALGGLLTSGCALHPLPDDVTGLSTYNIVRQIRCETREAVIDSILGFLTNEANYRGRKVDDASRGVGLRFKAAHGVDPSSITAFSPTMLSGTARTAVSLLWNTGIAYNYDLEMVEVNNVDPEINFLRVLPSSKELLGVKGNFDRQRQNTRSFTITDNFGGLVKNLDARYCTGYIVEANMIYPIAGKVGMERVVQDFLVLTLFGNLSGASKDVTSNKGPPTMVDQLQFQTSIGGSVTPKVIFTPIGPAAHVADATLGLAASRKDTHKLTVGLYLTSPGVTAINQVRASIFRGGLITASGGQAEQGAAAAVEQFLAQKLFQPRIVIQP
jgi:hypothetical protein